jgi:NADP-dependent 3-hydroxy acid dehydrogenase YdfG
VLGARRTDRLDAIVAELKVKGHTAVAGTLDVTILSQMHAFVRLAQETYGRVAC